MDQYDPGDEIYLFGFSRGAFTVRSVTGLIENSGVLDEQHLDKVKDAYEIYRSRKPEHKPEEGPSEVFRRRYSHGDTRIKFVGVWDTVGALGIPEVPWFPIRSERINKRWAFHNPALCVVVDRAYQALAIDERRDQFKTTLWVQKDSAPDHQVLEQVWFAGAHSNVGGGYKDHGLSDVAFMWMKNKAKACGLAFDEERLAKLNCVPDHLGLIRDSRVGLYKLPLLAGPYDRPIGTTNSRGNESIHPSVTQRREAAELNPRYNPVRLAEYLQARRDH